MKVLTCESVDSQHASAMLTTCSRRVIIKPEQADANHPDNGLMTARQQAVFILWNIYLSVILLLILDDSCKRFKQPPSN